MGQIDDRIVRFSGIKPGVYTYEMLLDDTFFKSFENEEIKGGRVHFDVKMERNERVTMLTFVFQGEVKTECDRCLGEMTVNVSGEERLNVRFSDSEVSDDEQVVILPEEAAAHATHPPRRRMRPGDGEVHRGGRAKTRR